MKKRILTLTLVLCMLLSILPVTAMAATVQDLLDELDTTTFSYLYDAQRRPSIPEKAGASFNLHGLDFPLTSTGSRYTYCKSSWTLTRVGSYADFKNTHTPSSSMTDIISLVENAYASANLTADTVLIHELKENGNHVAYGVVIAYTSGSNGYAAFLGDTHYNGTGYFLSKTALDTTQSYDVYANMIATDFVQDIALDTVGTYDFGAKPSGYDASTLSHEFTVTNVGTVATGKMNITVTDSNDHSIDTFVVSPNQLASIESQNGTHKFAVTPKAGLAAGTYNATITVNGDNVTPKSFNVKFVVTEALTPAITLNQSNIDFGSATVGYSAAPAAQTVTVTSTGTAATGELTVSVDNTSDFNVSPATIASLNASTESTGKTASITVQPKTGLAVGEHNATVTVRGTGVTPQSFNVKFVVSEAPKAVLVFGDSTRGIGCTLKEGYTNPDPLVIPLKNSSDVAANITSFSVEGEDTIFTVSAKPSTVGANSSVDLTITPKTGLTVGKHTGKITLEGNFTKQTLDIEIKVEAKPSEPVYTPSYAVTAASAEHGTVALSAKSAYAGSAVTVTVTPDEGYALSSLTAATRSGANVALTDLGSGRYRFTMPASDVTVTAAFAAGEKIARFVDVPVGSTFFDAVEWAAAKGVTTGTTDTTFSPANACTRGQIVTFLWRAFGSPEPKTAACPFSDVAEDSFCYKAVLWAVENGITTVTTDTTFSPNVPCTRAQAVTLLYRAVGSPAVSGTSGFADVPAGAYCGSAVTWAVEKGVTTGTTDGLFAPGVNCNRGQIVAFLFRALFAQK